MIASLSEVTEYCSRLPSASIAVSGTWIVLPAGTVWSEITSSTGAERYERASSACISNAAQAYRNTAPVAFFRTSNAPGGQPQSLYTQDAAGRNDFHGGCQKVRCLPHARTD